MGGWLGSCRLGRRLVVEFFTHGVSQLGLALCVISLLGALVSGLIVALRNRRHRNAVLLTSAETLAGYWNFIFSIVYYLVAVPEFSVGGFLFTRVPKTPRPRKTPGLKRSIH